MTSTGGMNGHPVPGVGHNSGPALTAFEEVVKTNLKEGLLLAIKHTIVTAHRDGRLERRHYRVLCEIIDVINTRSGMAFPGQALLAEKSGYTVAVIRKTVSELIQFGYLVNTRRAPAGSTRALAHYTIRRPSIEEMHAAISAWVEKQRAGQGNGEKPWQADVTNGGNVTPVSNITNGGNIMTAADVTPVVPADVTPVVQTVTVRGTEEEKGEDARTDRSTSTPGPSGRRSPPSQAGGRIGPNRATTRAEMGAALNPEVAYAERNIVISPSGKLTIGQELRTELREAFTDEQIDGALDCTLAPMGTNRNKVQILAQLRRQCTFKRENDKRPASGRPSTSKGVF